MMYNEKLAVAIKSAGRVLREFNKDTVYVPFGAEYSIYIKNMNTVRALVKVSIDNQPVDGNNEGFVIGANDFLDLERFLKSGNLKEGNRFKFIERTGKIEQHRGIGVEDGLIRVEFQYEKVLPKVEEVHHYTKHYYHDDYYWDYYWGRPYYRPYRHFLSNSPVYGSSGIVGSNTITTNSLTGGRGTASGAGGGSANGGAGEKVRYKSSGGDEPVSVNFCNSGGNGNVCGGFGGEVDMSQQLPTMDSMINEAGITVAGSKSDQQFVKVDSFTLEEASHVIVLKLLGETVQGKRVKQAVTVKTKQKCPTCGHVNKATTKFCAECGTALEVL